MKLWKAFILLSAAFLSACNDTPNSFGDDFIPNEDRYKFQQAENNSIADSNFYKEILPSSVSLGEAVVLGKSGDLVSTVLMRVPLTAPDSIKSMLQEGSITITSTWVKMNSLYYIGDKNGTFDFTGHRINAEVNFDNIKPSTFPSVTYDQSDIIIPGSKVLTDSTLIFKLNTNLVKDWIKVQYDSVNTPRNYGIILKPTSNTTKLLSFLGYETTFGTATSVFFEFEKRNSSGLIYKDTLSAFATKDTYYATQPAPAQTDQYITVQGGFAYRNKIKFNLPQLPTNAVMNQAILEIYYDSLKSVTGTAIDTDYGNFGTMLNIGYITDPVKLSIDSLTVQFLSRQTSPYRGKFAGDITAYAQKWINEGKNNGLLLTINGEEYDLSRLVFFGSNYSVASLRPKLKITYSIRNK